MQKRIRATDGIGPEMNCRRSWRDGSRDCSGSRKPSGAWKSARERKPRARASRRRRRKKTPRTTARKNKFSPARKPPILPGADGFVQAYNTQIAVEPDFQWI